MPKQDNNIPVTEEMLATGSTNLEELSASEGISEEISEEIEESIFRETSKSRLSHPEQLDALLTVIPPASWIILAVLLLLLLFGIGWAFFGSLPVKVDGRGIFMSQEGGFTVQTMLEGIVKNIYVAPGDVIKAGDLITEIDDPRENLKLRDAEYKVDNLTEELAAFRKAVNIEAAAIQAGLQSELNAKNFAVQQKEMGLASLSEDLEKKKALFKEGLISASALRDQELRVIQENIEIETIKAAAEGIKANLLKQYRAEEIKQKEQSLQQATEVRDLLRTNINYSKVYAPNDGKVLEIFINVGDRVLPGQSLLWIEPPFDKANPLLVYGYFPIEEGKRIALNQEVKISLGSGFLLGHVKEISQYAVTSENLLRLFHSKALEQYLTSGSNAVIHVMIDPELGGKPENKGGYIIDEEGSEINSGTVAKLQAIVERIRPIYYLLPIKQFKTKEGL